MDALSVYDAEVIEAKGRMNTDVIGQVVAGASLLARAYPNHPLIPQTVVVGGEPDPALDWVCVSVGSAWFASRVSNQRAGRHVFAMPGHSRSNRLPSEVGRRLGPFYVYALTDPRSDEIFYVGKGSRGRVGAHVREGVRAEMRTAKGESAKQKRIRGFVAQVPNLFSRLSATVSASTTRSSSRRR